MSTILTSYLLVGILQVQPYLHIQMLDRFSSLQECTSVVEKVAEKEVADKVPQDERISPSLKCLQISYRYNPDGDGPSKPSPRKAPVDI